MITMSEHDSPVTDTPACPTWCREDHAEPDVLFHESAPRLFGVTYAERLLPEPGMVTVKGWVLPDAEDLVPDCVVMNVERDSWGDTWLTAAEARLLAEHLLGAARELDSVTGASA